MVSVSNIWEVLSKIFRAGIKNYKTLLRYSRLGIG